MPKIYVSVGELVDKISILEIKKTMFLDPTKLYNVLRELSLLKGVASEEYWFDFNSKIYEQLKEINYAIWRCEEWIRIWTKDNKFDQEFIDCAINIHKFNDKRAQLKKEINSLYKSDIIEEKSYEGM